MGALKCEKRDIFQGNFDLRVSGRGKIVLPDAWEKAIGDRTLVSMHHQKSGKILLSLEELMDEDYMLHKEREMNSYTQWHDRRNFDRFSLPFQYLQDVRKRGSGFRVISPPFENFGSKAFKVAAQGRGPYFLMQPFDDCWKLDKPSALNHAAAYLFVLAVDPKVRPSDPGQNPTGLEPVGV